MSHQHRRYQMCHQIMLLNPEHTPCENKGVTYILAQITDTEGAIRLNASLINPDVPPTGHMDDIFDLTPDQQIGIFALRPIQKVLSKIQEEVVQMNSFREENESAKDFAVRFKKLLKELK